jgi:hypothetical protein
MKNSQSGSLLLVLLAVAALLSVALCWYYVSSAREVRMLQAQMQGQLRAIQQNSQFIGVLGNELLEYSKTHQDIDPILEAAGIKQGKASPTNAPSATTKPATKK